MDELTAVVLRYWTRRDANIRKIIDDLRAGTVVPSEIVVVDQAPGNAVDCPDFGVPVIRLPRNYRTRARYIAALLHTTPYHLFIDDDLTVEANTVEVMLAAARPGRVVTVRGVWGDVYDGERLPDDRPRPCDWMIGRLHLAHWRALVRYLEAEERYRIGFDDPVDCADMLLGRVNDCVSVPAGFRDLPSHQVGLDLLPDYAEHRNKAIARFAEVGL